MWILGYVGSVFCSLLEFSERNSWFLAHHHHDDHLLCSWYCWYFRNPAHQLRLVVYPIIYRVLPPSKRWLGMGFLNHQQYLVKFSTIRVEISIEELVFLHTWPRLTDLDVRGGQSLGARIVWEKHTMMLLEGFGAFYIQKKSRCFFLGISLKR